MSYAALSTAAPARHRAVGDNSKTPQKNGNRRTWYLVMHILSKLQGQEALQYCTLWTAPSLNEFRDR